MYPLRKGGWEQQATTTNYTGQLGFKIFFTEELAR